jgi:hypothetical protein
LTISDGDTLMWVKKERKRKKEWKSTRKLKVKEKQNGKNIERKNGRSLKVRRKHD